MPHGYDECEKTRGAVPDKGNQPVNDMADEKSANAGQDGNGAAGASRRRSLVIPLSYPDKDSLYKAYMSFLKSGGLFFPTSSDFELNEELFLLVTLMDDAKPVPVSGNVVWITSAGSIDGQKEGIGVEFKGKDGEQMKGRIEGILGPSVNNSNPTYTM